MHLNDIIVGMHCAVKLGATRQRVIVEAIQAPEGVRTWHLVAVRRPGSSRVLKTVRIEAIHEIGPTFLPMGPNGEMMPNEPSTEQSRDNILQSHPINLTKYKTLPLVSR